MKFLKKLLPLLLLAAMTGAFVACGEEETSGGTQQETPGGENTPGSGGENTPGSGGENTPGSGGEQGGDEDKPEMTLAEVLSQISGKATFTGTCSSVYTVSDYDTTTNASVSFGEKDIWVYEEDAETHEVLFDYIAVDHDGELALVYHDIENKVVYKDTGDDFSASYNPFAGLKEEDFALQNGMYVLTDAEKVKTAAVALCGHTENFTLFGLQIEEDAISVHIASKENVFFEQDAIYYDNTYEYTVEDIGTGCVPTGYDKPYELTEGHAALVSALEKAAAAKSYTIHRTEIYALENNMFDVFVTENAIYSEETKHGILEKNGNVFGFAYDPETGVTLSAEYENSFAELLASFSGFSPALFEETESGMWSFRPDFYLSGMTSGTAAQCARAFSLAGDDLLESAAVELDIALRGGELFEVYIRFYAEGGDYGELTLNYSDFDKTELPIDISDAKTLYETIKGSYTGKDLVPGTEGGYVYKDYAIEVTDSQILVTFGEEEPVAAENVTIDTGLGYLTVQFTAGDAHYILSTHAGPRNAGLILMTDDYETVHVVLIPEDFEQTPVETDYPYSYYGTYESKAAEGETAYTVEIGAEGITITAGEEVTVITEDILYTTTDGISIIYKDVPYFIFYETYNSEGAPFVQNISLQNSDGSVDIKLTRTGEGVEPEKPFVMPERYIGVFTGTGTMNDEPWQVSVEITAEGISVSFNGGEAVTPEFTFDEKSHNFYFTIEDVNYVIMVMTESSDLSEPVDTLQFEDDDNYRNTATLHRKSESAEEPEIVVPQDFLGTWEGTGSDGKKYVLKIEAEHITVTVDDGTPTVCDYTEIKNGNDLFFVYEGETYDIYMNKVGDSASFALWQETPSAKMIVETLTPQSESGGEELGIAATFLGKFEGTVSGKNFVVEITETAISVTIDGAAATCEFVSCEQQGTSAVLYYRLKVKINGEDYTIDSDIIKSEDTPTSFLELSSHSFAKLNRVSE